MRNRSFLKINLKNPGIISKIPKMIVKSQGIIIKS
jgi:hypothetical protein